MNTIQQYVTIQDAADRLSISVKTIRRMIARGELRAVRVGKRMVRVDVASLDAIGRPLAGTVAA